MKECEVFAVVCALMAVLFSSPGAWSGGEVRLKLATTTSTANSGLLDVLNPPFEKMLNVKVDVIPVGTGKALKMGATGDVDVVFVHARAAEDTFVDEGHGVNRRDVMYNDFVIVGPKNDPAGIKGLTDAKVALTKVAAAQLPFISRGDDSGTHKKEKLLWKKADSMPSGKWYFEAGQGMGAVLTMASEKQAYALADRGTFLAFSSKIDLVIACEGDADLFNPYGIIAVNPAKYTHAEYVYAMAYIGWVTSREGQDIIREYGKKRFGNPLFTPIAIP